MQQITCKSCEAKTLLVDPLHFICLLKRTINCISILKAGPLRLKQLTNTLKIRILSETSILYLIR